MPKKLTIAEIAVRHGIPKRTVLWNAQTGALKATRVGMQGMYLVTERDLADWLAGRDDDNGDDITDLPVYVKEN